MDQSIDPRLRPALVSFPLDGERDGSFRALLTGRTGLTAGPGGRPPLTSFDRRTMWGDAKHGSGARAF
ncbi:MAG: hypothetical protein ACR2OO_04920 [Thermomicrobiales bacterium]